MVKYQKVSKYYENDCLIAKLIRFYKLHVTLRFFDWLAKYESLKDEELENIRKRDLIANEVEVQKDGIEKQNDNIEELIALLEEQTAMTQKIAQRLDI